MKASIRSVVMVGALALVLFACGDSPDTVDNPTSTTSGDNGTTTTAPATTTSVEPPICSATGLAISNDYQPNDLPAVVSEVRSELPPQPRHATLSFWAPWRKQMGPATPLEELDPAAYWGDLEANGETPLADMVKLLELEPALFDVGEGNVFYVLAGRVRPFRLVRCN